MTYQNYRLCHGCRHTYTNQGQELNGIFYCTSCASIRSNNRQSIARRAENTPSRTVSIVSNSLTPNPTSRLLGSIGNTTQPSNTHNSIQAQSSFYSKLFSFLQKHPLITTITIIITIFTIVSIVQVNKENVTENQVIKQNQTNTQNVPITQSKTQNNNQTKLEQKNSSITKQNSSIEPINNETFAITKYVSTNGLNARYKPGNYRSLFVIPQNAIVYLSSSRTQGAWCVIKYKEKLGWVNKTYLRDFTIKSDSIRIGNHSDKGSWITKPGNSLYSSEMEHLGIELSFVTLNETSENIRLLLKIVNPNNEYIQGEQAPTGYSEQYNINIKTGTQTHSYGTFDIPGYYYRYSPGIWYVQIYYENPSNPTNTLACIASKKFTLY